jgi:muconolactone delta-isomerase
MSLKWFAFLIPLLLSACMGVNPNSSPKDQFTVPVAFEVIYERAKAQAQRCWSADGEFPVIGSLNKSDRTAFVAVTGQFGSTRYAEVEIRALGDQSTQVQVYVNGTSIWDVKSLAAMHEVLQFGVPTCISYMPRPQQ